MSVCAFAYEYFHVCLYASVYVSSKQDFAWIRGTVIKRVGQGWIRVGCQNDTNFSGVESNLGLML